MALPPLAKGNPRAVEEQRHFSRHREDKQPARYQPGAMNAVLYFTGNDGRTGHELWQYNPANCVAPSTVTVVQGGSLCRGNAATITVKAAQAGVRD